MFYLTQFCRICVQNKCEMQHIDGDDYDAIKFSEKLQRICHKLVISEEDHSRVICNECIQRLRISYAFTKMCARSDRLLQQYLDELTSAKCEEQFVNSELRVTIVPIPRIQIKVSGDGPQAQVTNRVNIKRTLVRMAMSPGVKKDETNANSRMRRKLKSEASFKISDAYRERLRKLCHNKLRITKEKRCIILRHLLQKVDKTDGEYLRWMPRKDCQLKQILRKEHKSYEGGKRWIFRNSRKIAGGDPGPEATNKTVSPRTKHYGGLRDLLSFIEEYDFGFVINESDIKEQCDPTALDRLESFSNTFFFSNFDDYHSTILAIANESDSSDDEGMFGPFDEDEDRQLWPECSSKAQFMPRISIKRELFSLLCMPLHKKADKSEMNVNEEWSPENEAKIKRKSLNDPELIPETEIEYNDEESGDQPLGQNEDSENDEQLLVPSEFVQTCYEEEEDYTEDEVSTSKKLRPVEQASFRYKINMAFQKRVNSRKHPKRPKSPKRDTIVAGASANLKLPKISVIPEASTSANCSLTSLDWLTRLTNNAKLPKGVAAPFPRKTISPNHARCRTRGNPFINPQLMQQFQMRTFKCDTCNRCFKSPGYLHSHCTKMGH